MTKQIKITQVRSLIGSQPKHKLTMQAIGFRRHQETLTKNDTPQLRGMLHQVRHLVRVEEVKAARAAKTKPKAEASAPPAPELKPAAGGASRLSRAWIAPATSRPTNQA